MPIFAAETKNKYFSNLLLLKPAVSQIMIKFI